jgi:hypothetical protein
MRLSALSRFMAGVYVLAIRRDRAFKEVASSEGWVNSCCWVMVQEQLHVRLLSTVQAGGREGGRTGY